MITQKNGLELVREFELDGVKYGFIPNLETMSYGEYLDLSSYSKSTWENLAIIMSILYRPITKTHWSGRYDIEPYAGTNDDRIRLFSERLGMDIVFGATGFFLNLQTDLSNYTLTYTIQEMQKILETPTSTAAQILAESGVSTQQLQLLQEMIQQSSTQSQD
jgi:hypothetical protein